MLTNIKIENAKPKDRPYKMYDINGLYLIVTPSGGKWWRFDYSMKGKRNTVSLGVYPDISLKEARIRRDEAKRSIAQDIKPSTCRKSEKEEPAKTHSMTYGELALEWFEKKKNTWAERHAETVMQRINNYIIPALGNRDPSEITPQEIYRMLQRIEDEGKVETAHRVKQVISMIFRYGIIKGVALRDPAMDLGRGALTVTKPKHYPAILEPDKIGALMRAIYGYAFLVVRCAVKLLAFTFVRPGELRHARWEEIKLDEKFWEIPAERMKMRKPHIVPLSRQAIEVLKTIQKYTGNRGYVFPSPRGKDRPISDMTINATLQRMGYDTKKDITAHGFRAMARTILHERLKFPPEVIEHQLAHAVPDMLGEAYNRTKFIDERKKMMQAWADYLDELRKLV